MKKYHNFYANYNHSASVKHLREGVTRVLRFIMRVLRILLICFLKTLPEIFALSNIIDTFFFFKEKNIRSNVAVTSFTH